MAEHYENLTVERDGHVTVVTFNRPDRANALDHAHLVDIEAAALSFREDAETRAIVFTGAGKHFSSGHDLASRPPDGDLVRRRRTARMGERAVQALQDIDQITVAAWNGAAMGGGACLATALDLRIGADDCFMQSPEIDIGVTLMWKSLPLITHIAGPSRTKRLVVGGERVHAETLLAWGVLDELVPRPRLLDRALEVAAFYAAKPPIAAQMIKRSVNAIVSSLDTAVMHMDVDQNLLTAMTEDRRAAIQAYLDKTKPSFTGN